MRFSILIPVYNVEQYLDECLQSVLRQSFSDFEVVIVDDGSTDGSGLICDTVAEQDKRVRVVHQRNKGLLLARRAAIDIASGEYLVCVDSDDSLRHDALEVLDEAIRRTDADIICFQATRQPGFRVPYLDFGQLANDVCTVGDGGMWRVRRMLSCSHMLNQMWSKAFRLRIADAGADYSAYEGLQYGEDLFQTCPLFDRASTVAFIDEILYYYRMNMDSISHTASPSRLSDIKVARGRLAEFAERWDPSFVPLVHANDCVEFLVYAIKVVLSGEGDGSTLRRLSFDPFLREALFDADFSFVSRWKVPLIHMIARGDERVFRVAVHLIFGPLRIIAPQRVVHYL